MLRERYQPTAPMPTFSTHPSASTSSRPSRGLLARVYEIARAEARGAQVRRGLPFSGMFCSDEHLTAQNAQASAPRA